MATDWVHTRLGEVADILTGFPFRSQNYVEDASAPRLLRGDNVVQGTLRWNGAKHWPSTSVDEVAQYQLREGDVVLAMDRPWIEAGLKYAWVRRPDLPALLVQRVARLRGTIHLDPGFLRYVIGSRAFTEYVLAIQTGTAVPHISIGQVKDFEFMLPPLEEQRAIAHILGALDDKIELNRQMGETLEAMARALFKSWFVDFDPVRAKAEGRNPGLPESLANLFPSRLVGSELGDIPEGWEVKPVGETAQVLGGGTPSTKQPRYWSGVGHPFCTPKDMSGLSSPVLLQTERHLTDEGVSKISSGKLPVGTVLLSSRAPIGYLAIAEVPVSVNQGIIAMVCDGLLPNLHILLWASANMEVIEANANGSTFPEISKMNFRAIPVVVPPSPVLEQFSATVNPAHERVVANVRASTALVALRDALLPRLVSGEMRVRDRAHILEATI